MNTARSRRSKLVAIFAITAAVTGWGVPAAPTQTAAAAGPTVNWIAAGDSYSSGYSLPDAIPEPGCQRASGDGSPAHGEAWPVKAERDLESRGTLDVSPFIFVACEGAVTAGPNNDFAAEMRDLNHNTIRLLTFNFGGDDVNFKSIIQDCVQGVLVGTFNPWDNLETAYTCPSDSSIRAMIASKLVPHYQK